ncbi:NAD(P)-dependent oxidoreductase [Achromobacter aloeverae]|uniref:D-isomer specific 2-hydroxyacid dehydrogenase NAD-binding domain-containing protein n=1 Tax=Achromobacter aloeverae TaxID=1750518 RepID=A0A4Q1HIM7_9BURK|nr:NAD(P)-dependent oxidoreductase [Achromobacter aloeverae]RXN88058.1 hypothetical protein C7R54_15905 [Achromobacter aloeverae]
MKILVAGLHAPNAPRLAALLGAGFDVLAAKTLPAQGKIDVDVLVTNRLAPDEAARFGGRLVQVPGAGVDAIAVDAVPASSNVCNVHGHEIPIAEYVVHAVLEHFLEPWRLPATLDEKNWPAVYADRPYHREAHGNNVAILGYGHIGAEIARRVQALGMGVIAVTRGGQVKSSVAPDDVATTRELETVLTRCAALVLCCPLTDETRGRVGDAALRALGPRGLLVNVARAEVVDEAALHDNLSAGRLGRAVLDVWYRYPGAGETSVTPARLPLHALPNVRGTPHVSALTPGLLERRYDVIAANIRALRGGTALRHVVRPAV